MTRTVHPSELSQFVRTHFLAKSAAVSVLIIALCLLAGGTRSQSPELRMWLFGSSLATAFISRQIHKIAIDAERQFDDSRDISLTNWQNQLFKRTRDDQLTLEVQAPVKEPERLPLFDWTRLQDEDEHPVIAIVAPMGGGKSRLARYLAKYAIFDKHPQITALDIYARSTDWENAAVDYASMLDVMKADLEEISDRIPRYRANESNFEPRFRVLEEAVDTLPNVRSLNKGASDIVDDWLRKHVSVARKIGYRLCLVSVKLNGADIGIGAESRDDSTVIFAGAKGVAKAMSDVRYLKLGTQQNAELRSQLQASLVGVKRPAIVFANGEWHPAVIPDLNSAGDIVGTIHSFDTDELEEPEENLTETLNKIEALAIRLQDENQNCTPGKVRKFIHRCKGSSDEEILKLFQTLESQERGLIDTSGRVVKFCPNAAILQI
ncbi:hypothetical protein Q2T42_21915 [Leptolyngbya boryana CZ1]|uniref:Uncharacterized protein n=1 Tax=Leptolyngbya boryana CZ1 TaxID=3060204 RepID=A0AA96WRF6_LEPBY|nr:hypothetical protein [Leptolyngbya boryana]WNZ44460.1 hypothetical protein Q2T42_21915 [Leptolyngbya boryana CZ1]